MGIRRTIIPLGEPCPARDVELGDLPIGGNDNQVAHRHLHGRRVAPAVTAELAVERRRIDAAVAFTQVLQDSIQLPGKAEAAGTVFCQPMFAAGVFAQDLSVCTSTFPVACCKESYAKHGPFGTLSGSARRARGSDMRACVDRLARQKAR